MKKIVSFFFFFSCSLMLFAQISNVSTNDGVIGHFLSNQKEIEVKKYYFESDIEQVFIDSAKGTFTVQLFLDGFLSKKRKIVYYDYNQKKIRWEKLYKNANQHFAEFDNFMYSENGQKLTAINMENGQDSWNITNTPYFIDNKHSIIVGYDNDYSIPEFFYTSLRGYSALNGKPFWQMDISREFGWRDLVYINDSTIVLAASGLHRIDLKTGNGWYYQAKTGKKAPIFSLRPFEYVKGNSKTLNKSSYHAASGSDIFYDICSNIVKDTSLSFLYFASADKVSCLDYKGKEVWVEKIPNDFGSKSSIFIKDSILYFVNQGMAKYTSLSQYGRNIISISYGRALFGAYNRYDGTRKFLKVLDSENIPVLDYILQKDSITFVHRDKLVKYNIKNGEKIKQSNLNLDREWIYGNAVRTTFTKNTDSLYHSVYNDNSIGYMVYTNEKRMYLLDNQLNLVNSYPYDKLYSAKEAPNGLIFLKNDKETLVLDKNYKTIAKLDTKVQIFFVKNKAYFVRKSILFEIDLKIFLE